MTKVFGLAAILLALAACNKIEPVAQSTDQAETQQGIPFKATITRASTKALADAGETLTATWAVNEKIALIYEVSSTKYLVEANVDEVTAGGKAVISATLDPAPADNAPVTLIYPYSAVDGETKALKTDLLVAQNGALTGENSISEKYDVRTGSGNLAIEGKSASLKSDVALSNEFAIYKFTLNAAATAFRVTIDASDYVATPASETNVIFMALPAISGKAVSFKATEGSKDYYFSAPSVTLAAGTYYRSDLSGKLKTNPGRLGGQFSVAADRKVYFSQGNLQWFYGGNKHKTKADATDVPGDYSSYNGGIFTFADHQWDIAEDKNVVSNRRRGNAISNPSTLLNYTASKRIDLFMWATSGYKTSDDYHFKPFAICNNGYWGGSYPFGPLTDDIAGTDSDWGVFNAILNGGDEVNQWRTLTKEEWSWLIHDRTNAENLRGVGTVNGIRGVIILPDGWTGSFNPVTAEVKYNTPYLTPALNWTDNVYDEAGWTTMEASGAVFLPAAGTLDPGNNEVGYNNESDARAGSSYWTASWIDNRDNAYALDLGTGGINPSTSTPYINWRFDHSSRPYGRAVRLVQDVPAL